MHLGTAPLFKPDVLHGSSLFKPFATEGRSISLRRIYLLGSLYTYTSLKRYRSSCRQQHLYYEKAPSDFCIYIYCCYSRSCFQHSQLSFRKRELPIYNTACARKDSRINQDIPLVPCAEGLIRRTFSPLTRKTTEARLPRFFVFPHLHFTTAP